MIQIVKHGNKAYLSGTCEICGCGVVCNPSDAYNDTTTTAPVKCVKCPECGGVIRLLSGGQYTQSPFEAVPLTADCINGEKLVLVPGEKQPQGLYCQSGSNSVSAVGSEEREDCTSARVNEEFVEFCKINNINQ